MIRAIAYRQGRQDFEFELAGVPEFAESIYGGFTSATIPAVIPQQQRSRLLGAKVIIYSDTGAVWYGFVKTVPDAEGVVDLGLIGYQLVHSQTPRGVSYCETSLEGDLAEYEEGDVPSHYRKTMGGGTLRVAQAAGTSISVTNSSIGWEIISETPLRTLMLDVNVNHAHMIGEIFTRATVGGAPTLRATFSGVGVRTNQVVPLGGAARVILVRGRITTVPSHPTRDDIWVSFWNLRRYGTTIRPVTASAVVADVLSTLPAAVLPVDAAHRSVETTSRVIEPLAFGPGVFDAERLNEVNRYDPTSYQFVPGPPGSLFPLARFRTIPTEPAYVAEIDGVSVLADFADDDLDGYASAVRVLYTDIAGNNTFTDVVDPDPNAYLSAIGMPYVDVISVNTTSESLARRVGEARIAGKAGRRKSGKAIIKAPIRNMAGRVVTPDQVRAGERIQLLGTSIGNVSVLIVDVKHIGDLSAELTLEAYVDDFEQFLARLEKGLIK